MVQQVSTQSNFKKGLLTEFTGLNFPEDACTQADNCVFTILGDVLRRAGINFEDNYVLNSINTSGVAISYFRWLNAGGDGDSQVLVVQVGETLYFFDTSAATATAPISAQQIMTTIPFSKFQATGNTDTIADYECQFSAGNGYLFVYHPSCDPFYCTFNPSTLNITSALITIQIRDFTGYYPEPGNPSVTSRSSTLTSEHQYNLLNQGWTGAPAWTATANNNLLSVNGLSLGDQTFTVSLGLPVTVTQEVTLTWTNTYEYYNSQAQVYGVNTVTGSSTGAVVSYSGNGLIIDVTTSTQIGSGYEAEYVNSISSSFTITPGLVNNTINTWFSDLGNYPSNSDIWWLFKDDGSASGDNGVPTFNPSTTYANIMQPSSLAPQGHFILNVFNQNQTGISGISSLTNISTGARPTTGTWFQGRVWYSGIDSSQAASGDQNFYTWTENIYFSQIITSVNQFGYCYQANDPTDENFFDLLPDDGGVIQIQGCGSIHKLFPIQNGLLVFADNGIWFITGSQGIGFAADDYTITKISAVRAVSNTSFVDVLGMPFFWNEEGIYMTVQSQNGVQVEPITVETILTFYNDIPKDSKLYVRGDYDPISYIIQWTYRSTAEAGLSNRYQFDSALSFNTITKAFYPYSFGNNSSCYVNGIVYINYPTGTLTPQFKYLTSVGSEFTFSEENDDVNWVDFYSYDNTGVNYLSSFTTAYNLSIAPIWPSMTKAIAKWQPIYAMVYSRNTVPTQYLIQGVWDFASSGNSGKYSTQQLIYNNEPNFGMIRRRIKIRGHGESLQLFFQSVPGQPFDIMGWSILSDVERGI